MYNAKEKGDNDESQKYDCLHANTVWYYNAKPLSVSWWCIIVCGDEYMTEDDIVDEPKDYGHLSLMDSPLILRMKEVAKTNCMVARIMEDIELYHSSIDGLVNPGPRQEKSWIDFDISRITNYAYDPEAWYPDLKQIECLQYLASNLCERIALLKTFEGLV